jgi:hypothetical protein
MSIKDLEFLRAFIVFEETECDSCVVHMPNLTTMQTKYVYLFNELVGLKSRTSLLGAR